MATKADVAREYRDKYGMDVPTRELARLIAKNRPKLFSGIDDARNALRRVEGKNNGGGTKITHPMKEERPKNPYKIPESYSAEPKFYKLPLCNNNIGVISDTHIPYHSINTITRAIDYWKHEKVNTIVLLGDVIDLCKASKFENDPEKRDIVEEFDATRAFLVTLREQFPDADIHWVKGNHDLRLEHYLRRHALILYGDRHYHLEERLRLNELRIKLHHDKTIMLAGNLGMTHGHHVAKSRGQAPAKVVFNKSLVDMMIGHLHYRDTFFAIDAMGKTYRTYVLGCACETKPDYNPIVAQNTTGFAHILVGKNGDYRVRNFVTDHNGNIIDG